MIRPRLAVPAALLAAAALAGCTTFTDNSAAARVADDELSGDDLDDLMLAATPGAADADRVDVSGDTARGLISTWVLTRILEDDLEAAGGAIADSDLQTARLELEAEFEAQGTEDWSDVVPESLRELQVAQRAAINVWSAVAEVTPDAAELRASYESGIDASGIACTAHILVETEAEAAEIVDELASGGDFATLAGERSVDTGSGADGGAIPCAGANEFAQSYVPEYVDAALAAEVGVPTEPVQSQFGYHVILVRPFDEVADEAAAIFSQPATRFRRAAVDAEVYVDPRFGTFDPVAGVVALG